MTRRTPRVHTGHLVSDTISEGARAFSKERDMFFLATADAEGEHDPARDPGERQVLGR